MSDNEKRVLDFLRDQYNADAPYCCFDFIKQHTTLDRKVIRRACRSLARRGLAVYGKGLWTEDGEMAGAGYRAVMP